MAVFEMESWFVADGKEREHDEAMRGWLRWVRGHRQLFGEWKSVRYFVKHVAGDESNRHFLLWEYDSLADYEAYKKRRADYSGPYAEYRTVDPYHMGVFDHSRMGLEFWRDQERELWIEEPAPAVAGVESQVTFLYYDDLAAARGFYGDLLGFAPGYSSDWVTLYRVTPSASIGIVRTTGRRPSSDARRDAAMVSIVVRDVDAEYARLRGKPGLRLQKEIYDHPSVPIRAFLLSDPGNYSVELFSWRTPR